MQHTLSFKQNGKDYISKPFDFEAFCLINERHADEKINGKYKCCVDAVLYMFDGTGANEETIKALGVSGMARLCNKLWDMYTEALVEASKNE